MISRESCLFDPLLISILRNGPPPSSLPSLHIFSTAAVLHSLLYCAASSSRVSNSQGIVIQSIDVFTKPWSFEFVFLLSFLIWYIALSSTLSYLEQDLNDLENWISRVAIVVWVHGFQLVFWPSFYVSLSRRDFQFFYWCQISLIKRLISFAQKVFCIRLLENWPEKFKSWFILANSFTSRLYFELIVQIHHKILTQLLSKSWCDR